MRILYSTQVNTAIANPEWPILDINPNGRMTRTTLTILENYQHIPEVAQFLRESHADFYVDSRLWHYLKRRYEDGIKEITEPADIDRLFEQILTDEQATIHRPGIRYLILSSDRRWVAVVDPAGLRVSVMLAKKPEKLRDILWTIADLNV